MPDLRYHLVSLISVFLALAIGVLLGTAIADRGVVDQQLRAQIADIENRFSHQQEVIAEKDQEIATLRAQLEAQDEISHRMAETIVAGRLQGVDVAVVAGPYADEEVSRQVQETLQSAGADLGPVIRLEPPDREQISAASFEPYARAALEIAGSTLEIRALEDVADVIAGGPRPEGLPDVVVFVGGGAPVDPEAAEPALDFLATAQEEMFGAWEDAGIRVVAAESSFAANSEIPLYQSAGISSVDNADMPAGRAALVLLASGAAEGSYGVKPTASSAFPEPSS
ncbi:hypothetical protein E0L93_06900 [Rubrobacter taiwanensis]|jgi:hypothetical protein|uniref:Copper transporter n=1 Tax=Rubrobacter taiwanensis TaxID=185139 RepID=A0A4R1BJA4_9ACTN|nr:copper transporter [Rubrobacter taiwanensis]TCJ17258.1 hypothetical protein E0L93_06900 [Rubrobacter taiwanensis]